jgi:hypothetical protein
MQQRQRTSPLTQRWQWGGRGHCHSWVAGARCSTCSWRGSSTRTASPGSASCATSSWVAPHSSPCRLPAALRLPRPVQLLKPDAMLELLTPGTAPQRHWSRRRSQRPQRPLTSSSTQQRPGMLRASKQQAAGSVQSFSCTQSAWQGCSSSSQAGSSSSRVQPAWT